MFEITEGQSIVAHGRVRIHEDSNLLDIKAPVNDESFMLLESDFYNEMRQRGYQHKDAFRAIIESRDDGLEGKIKWKHNWAAFIDCLLQFQVLLKDTRMLVLPTKFRSMIINPLIHKEILSKAKNEIIEATSCPYQKVIQAGGIELHEFEGTSVNRRRPIDPILEVHSFVPHMKDEALMSPGNLAKFCIQLLIENSQSNQVLAIEIDANDGKTPLSEHFFQSVRDLPMVTSEINYLTASEIKLDNVSVSRKDLSEFSDAHIIVKSGCMHDADFLKSAKLSLHPSGLIVSREAKSHRSSAAMPKSLQLIATVNLADEVIHILQFTREKVEKSENVLRITENIKDWLEPLKKALATGSTLIFAQNEKVSGILGLYNCIKREIPSTSQLTCVLIADEAAPPFDINSPFYRQQLQQGLAVNVLKSGKWGTYRHLKLPESDEIIPRESHCYVDCRIKGDMTTLNWFEGKIPQETINTDPRCIQVKYSALNFRDVMQASGKIQFTHLTRFEQQILLGELSS
jgi:fatty acid synthase, animal type